MSKLESREFVKPAEIETRSFEIIGEELKDRGIVLDSENELVIKRVIHTSADFEYADTLAFTPHATTLAVEALKTASSNVTDTKMAASGINRRVLGKFGGQVYNFMSDADVAAEAKERGCTRAAVCMERAAKLMTPLIYAIGNAPTALVRLFELAQDGKLGNAALIIGVPVGFVNVVESKELICDLDMPSIVAHGRKGGSNVAAAICNALLYLASNNERE